MERNLPVHLALHMNATTPLQQQLRKAVEDAQAEYLRAHGWVLDPANAVRWAGSNLWHKEIHPGHRAGMSATAAVAMQMAADDGFPLVSDRPRVNRR
jgi:hypothetical protein